MAKELKKYKLSIDAPGSEGYLNMKLTTDEVKFMKTLILHWNNKNAGHAQPFLTITEIKEQDGN